MTTAFPKPASSEYPIRRTLRVAVLLAACACFPRSLNADDIPVDLYGDPLPAGAAVRLGSKRFRIPGGRKYGLAFSANSRTLVVAADGGRLALLQVPTGKHMYEISTGKQWVEELRLLPEKQSVITLGHEFDETVPETFYSLKGWDLITERLVSSVKIAGGAHLQITPDRETAFTGNGIGVVQIWRSADGNESKSHRFGMRIDALALSPDAEFLAVSSSNRLYFWKWRNDDEAPAGIDLGHTVQSLAFSPDGSLLAEGADSGNEIKVRDARTQAVKMQLFDGDKNPMYVHSLAFSPDGKYLAGTNSIHLRDRQIDRRVHVWDVATGEIRQSFATGGDSPRFVAFSPNGRWLAAAGDDAVVDAWDMTTNKALGEEILAHGKEIVSIRLSQNGRTAVTASTDGSVRVWDAESGKQRHLMRHDKWVCVAGLSPDGRLIASSGLDNTVRLWETATGKELYRLPGHGDLGGRHAIAFAPDGQSFASWGDRDSYLRQWDVQTGKVINECEVSPVARNEKPPPRRRELGAYARQAVFSPDAREIVFYYNDKIVIFNVESGQEMRKLPHPDGHIVSLAVGPGTRLVAISAWGRGEQIPLANGGIRVSADKGHMVRVREVASDRELFHVELPDSSAGPLAFSADGRLLAFATRESVGSLHVLDAHTGAVLQEIEDLPLDPTALSFSGDGKRLACAYGHGTALIWDLKIPAAE
jgi:WD40 repeat protein